jgi:SHS2 domain-containing protein
MIGSIQPRWEHFPHPADVGIRGIGSSKEEAFQQVALALTAIITDPGNVAPRDVFLVELRNAPDDLLLVDWLNRLIYEMDTRGMLFSRFDVFVQSPILRARVWGEPLDPDRHRPAVEVKAATYHQAAVYQNDRGAWVAQCVVDV